MRDIIGGMIGLVVVAGLAMWAAAMNGETCDRNERRRRGEDV